MARRRRVWIFIVVLLILPIGYFLLQTDPLRAPARRQWKTDSIAQLQSQIADKLAIQQSLAAVPGSASGWVGTDLLLMKNGDWIACRNICRKENAAIHDLFISYGSDGKWYYSTFHFCRRKIVLEMEPQPSSLADFVNAYWLKEFDGKSDECLKLTWTGSEPWGDEKRQAGK